MNITGDAQGLPCRKASIVGAVPLPSFFIVGPPRTGTSWLYQVLKGHALLPEHTKETRFFDRHFQRGIAWYRAHYPRCVDHLPVGEIAPTYFASSEACERIAQIIPEAKVVCIFRNPIERLLSLYRLKCAYGRFRWSLEQAIVHDPELMNSSKYAAHLRAWQNAFGADQILATVYDDLCDAPQLYLDSVTDFIGVRRFTLSAAQVQRVYASEGMTHPRSYHGTRSATAIADWLKGQQLHGVFAAVKNSSLRKLFLGGGPPFSDLPQDAVHRLYDLFRPEVEELETILHRDLSAWKSHEGEEVAVRARRSASSL